MRFSITRDDAVRVAYIVGAVVAFTVYPFAGTTGSQAVLLLMAIATLSVIVVGMRRTERVHRRAWILILAGLALVFASTAARLFSGGDRTPVAETLDVAGYMVLLSAALALVLNHGRNNLGVVIDTAVAALAAGGVLWALVLRPHLPITTHGWGTLGVLLILLSLLASLGAVVQLDRIRPTSALAEVTAAVVLALVGNAQIAVAARPSEAIGAGMTFVAAYLAFGLFGLNANTQALFTPAPARPERLTLPRLIVLGLAIVITPALLGTKLVTGSDWDGVFLLVSSVAITALVVARIAQLSGQRDRAEQALKDLATHDPLTGLPNRREFQSRLDELTERHERSAILFCDLDRFKAVNDQYGHAGGDEILSQAAGRLRNSVRAGDVVCRYGGDEFVVLLPGISPAELETVSRRIDLAMSQPFQFDGEIITVGASIGVAMGGADSSAADLITRADHAMYDQKRV